MNDVIKIDPRKQFSKKLAKWTAVFWFVFMAWLSVLFLLVPACIMDPDGAQEMLTAAAPWRAAVSLLLLIFSSIFK